MSENLPSASPAKEPIQLPPELSERLVRFERRLRLVETSVALLAAVGGALATLVLLALLDRFVDTPPAVRIALAAGASLAVAGAAGWWTHHWILRRRDARDLARLVQRHYPRLGDRLLGAVELAHGAAAGASPALLRAALRQVAREAGAYRFEKAASTRAARRYAIGLAVLLLVLGLGALLAPEALWQSLRRLINPASELERYTFVRLADLPDEWIVPHGEPFELACSMDDRSRWRPESASARIGEQAVVKSPVRGGRAVFTFPGQTEEAPLSIRMGDVRRELRVKPVMRPELAALDALMEWPAYLGRKPETRRLERGRATVLEGSRIAFLGTTSRALGQAWLRPAPGPMADAEALDIAGETFRTASRAIEEWIARHPGSQTNTAALQLFWSDERGMDAARPFRVELIRAADEPPTVALEGRATSLAVLEEETLTCTVRAADDFGLLAMGAEWEIYAPNPDNPSDPLVFRESGERTLSGEAQRGASALEAPLLISPRMMGAKPGQGLVLYGWTEDAYPGRGRVRSAPLQIHVLSNEEHAQLIRDALAAAAARLDEAVREEERLLAQHSAMQELDDEALALARAQAMLEQGQQAEQANAAEVADIARDIEALMKEALRNPEFQADEIQPWMASSERLKQTANSAMQESSQALSRASRSPSSGERREQLDQAAQKEKEALDQMREAAEQLQQNMDLGAARNFINRLRETARMQREAAAGLVGMMTEAIGKIRPTLDPAELTALERVRAGQGEARRESGFIRDDLGAFFLRTKKDLFLEVFEAMSEPDILHLFDGADGLVAKNLQFRGAEAMESIAERHDAWAQQIEDGLKEDGSGGGGGGGGGEGLEPEVLFGLMRARVWEEMLRDQTRAAHERRDQPEYASAVARAAERQREITAEFGRLGELTGKAEAKQLLHGLSSISSEVAGLLDQPNSGPGTLAAQTEIIEVIAQAVQGQSGSSSGQSQQQGQSEADGEGPGEEAGSKPGQGSYAGGDSVPVGPQQGPGSGDGTRRGAERGAGDPATWPAEYRDAIQRYYEALETNP